MPNVANVVCLTARLCETALRDCAGYYNHRVFALNGMYPGGFCGAVGLQGCWEDGPVAPVMSCGTIWESVDLHSALGICVFHVHIPRVP